MRRDEKLKTPARRVLADDDLMTRTPSPRPPASEAVAPADERRVGASRLFDLAEKVVKLGAVLGAFGYMSLRAHLNYLGIPSTSSLGLERYLMETYNFTATTFVEVVVMIAVALLAFLFLYFVGSPILSRRRAGVAARLDAWVRGVRGKPFVPGLLLLATLAYYFWLLVMLSRHCAHVDVAVGRLVAGDLGQEDLSWLFYRTCVICVVGYLLYSYLPPAASDPVEHARGGAASPPTRPAGGLARFVWVSFLLSVVVLALQLPLLYGRLVRSPVYPLVKVTSGDAGGAPVCGLLVLETPSELAVWRAENGTGRVVLLPRSEIHIAHTGQTLNLLRLAREAAEPPTPVRPDCENYHEKPDS